MSINYNYSLGNDFPAWQWLPMFPGGAIYHGYDSDYDGSRYIYVAAQYGSSSTSASTISLWRFDTWGHGWQYLCALTSGNRGLSLTYDPIRNIVIVCHGAALTSWQVFNLNQTAVSVCGVSCAAFAATTMTPVLPAAADYGASLLTLNPATTPTEIDHGAVTAGTTSTTLIDMGANSMFMDGMVGLQIRLTSGTYSGQYRYITSVTDINTLVVGTAFGGTPSVGDTYVIELPQGTVSSATTSTLVNSAATWTVNQYSNCDVVITSGTGVGQKRRIASNTATTLTLATAVTGNANTGNWSVTPDATSVYKVQMSSDFLYYSCGSTGTGFYRIDLATGASATTWTTLSVIPGTPNGGANIMWAGSIGAFNVTCVRGNGSSTVYQHNTGLNTWSTLTLRCGSETFTTGASSTLWGGQRKLILQKEGTTRLYALNLAKRELEPLATVPYATPGAYDGHRLRPVTTPDGANWLYVQRAGGVEFFRVPLEWGARSC